MAAFVVTLIAAGTLAFGAVYPWAYVPLLAVAGGSGLVMIVRGGIRRDRRPLALGLLACVLAGGLQLVPLPRPLLDTVSPRAATILNAFSLTFAASGGTAPAPVSIDPPRTRIAFLAGLALAIYLLGLATGLGRDNLRKIPRLLAAFAVPLALFGIVTRNSRTDLVYWFWQPQDTFGAAITGPFVNKNHFGGWMLMATCLLVGSLFGQLERALRDPAQRRQRRLSWLSSAEANGILLMAGTIMVAISAIFLTMSRSAMTGLAASTVAFAWLVHGRKHLGTVSRGMAMIALTAAIVAGLSWRGPDRIVAAFQDDTSLLSRFDAWRDGLSVVRAFPWTGTGLNTYSDAMLFYQVRNRDFHLAQAHNDYLQLLAEGGMLVTVPIVVTVVLLALAVRRNLREAGSEARGYWIRAGAAVGMLAMAVQEGFEFSLQMPANTLLFATLAAAALSAAHARTGERKTRDTIRLAKDPVSGALS